jgi:Ca-activated chloride channel homolog
VNLVLSVTDSKGRFVDNLTADDLKLLDNHKPPEKWNYFQARTNLPLHVILAIDVSSSIRDRLRFEEQAASIFLKHILRKKTDEAAIVAFGSTVQEKTSGMTSDVDAVDAAIRKLQAGGETAMYDAIVASGRKLHERRRSTVVRPVIILITDGVDTASKSTLRQAEEAAARCEASIFALDANSIYETNPKGRLVLEKLTRETGGFVLPARENSDLKGAFSTIEKILRSQYALGYPPPELEANGNFRSIEVIANKRGLQIHARNGYYAPIK